MVIALNLHKMTLPQLTQYVQGQCADYGTVKKVSVHLYPLEVGQGQPFAIVEMSSPEENAALRRAIGDGYFAAGVSINLIHKT